MAALGKVTERTQNRLNLRFSKQRKADVTIYNVSLLVGVTGFEPTTSSSQNWRATNCATPRCYFCNLAIIFYHNGAELSRASRLA